MQQQPEILADEKIRVRFLIIRFSSIGDIVLTTPVIRCLKQQVEGAEVYFLTKKQYAPILENNPYINKLFLYDTNLNPVIKQLKKYNIHYIIDLHRNVRSKTIKYRLGILSFTFDKLNIKKWLLVNFKLNNLPNIHIVDRYFESVYLFDVKNDGRGLDYFLSEKDVVKPEAIPFSHRNGYISFAIGGLHNTKQLPVEKISKICKMIDYPIILLGGPEDMEKGRQIAISTGEKVFNACGIFTINQSAWLVQKSIAVISHDTGLMHIAAAFKKPILSVWGSTIPEFGMYPYLPGDESEIFEVKNLSCRPCSKLGKTKCPKNHFRCMNDIQEEKIVNKIKHIIANNKGIIPN